MKTILILLVLIINCHVYAQSTFQKLISEEVGCYSMQQTDDGGYIITGVIVVPSSMSGDLFLTKIDSAGAMQWQKSYSEIIARWEYGSFVQQTNDGGYIVTGQSSCHNTNSVMTWEETSLTKFDSSGNVMWATSLIGPGTEVGNCVRQTGDGGYIISISENRFACLVRTDSNGAVQWRNYFSYTNTNCISSFYCVQQTTDSGFVATGHAVIVGDSLNNDSLGNVFLVKTDGNGDTLWTRTYGGSGAEIGKYIEQTADGGYVIAGTTTSFGAGLEDIYIIKTDSLGDTLWSKAYGGPGIDRAMTIRQTTDGGYFISGQTASFGNGNDDCYFLRIDSTGILIWSKTFGGSGFDGEGGAGQEIADGSFVYAGSSTSFTTGPTNVYIIKMDSLGNSSGCNAGNPNTQEVNTSTRVLNPPPDIFTTGTTENIVWVVGGGGVTQGLCSTPVASYGIVEDTICTGNCINFDDLSLNFPTTWNWTFQGASPASSASSNPSNICYYTTGTYAVTLIVANAFGSDTLTQTITVIPCTAINELETRNGAFVFPTPSDGTFTVNSDISDSELAVTNILGEIVYQAEIIGNDQQIDLSSQPNGIYFVSMISEGETFTQKIVIQK